MRAAVLIKQVPSILLVGFLGYSVYSIQSQSPGSSEAQAELQKGLDRMVEDLFADSSEAAVKLEGALRDPFFVPAPAPTPRAAEASAEANPASAPPEPDALADLVRGLSLEATIVRGREQIAVINGRIYTRGQPVSLPGDASMPDRSLRVLSVTRTGVLLTGGGKHYQLGYRNGLDAKREPDAEAAPAGEGALSAIDPGGQLEMLQKLLNSPLGAMGRGLIGDAIPRPAGAARGRRPSGARAAGP